jgi:hypothetical protein
MCGSLSRFKAVPESAACQANTSSVTPADCMVEFHRDDWAFVGGWQSLMQLTPTNQFQILSGIELSGPSRFYRAVRVSRTGPRLSIRDVGGAVVIEWPADCPGCVLEESREIGPRASWSSTSAPAQVSGGRYQVMVPNDGPSRFYRLRSP